jgi:lysophospholipase L1-like esterase
VTAAAAAPRRRRWWRLPAALGLGALLAAGALELAFRLCWRLPPAFAEFEQAGLYVPTDDGDVALKPGYRGELQVDGRRTAVVVNGLGLRGPEIGARAAREARVLIGGDSVVFGYGVEAEEALPQRLQALLAQAAGRPVVVGNAGVPGYGTRNAVRQLVRADRAFGADLLVLCAFLGNDAVEDLRGERTAYGGLVFDGAMARLIRSSSRARLAVRSRAWLWFETWLFNNAPSWSPLQQLAPTADELAALHGLPGGYPAYAGTHAGLFLDAIDPATSWAAGAPPVLPRVLAQVRAALEQAKALAGARPLCFVVLPTRWQVVPAAWDAHLRELGFDAASFRRGLSQQRLLAVADELGVPAFDATPALAAAPEPAALFLADGGHLSVRGNEVLAAWLARELARRLPR